VKILWLSHLVPYPPHGGVLQRAYHLLRETARVHDVYLLAFVQKDLVKIHYPNIADGLRDAKENLQFCRSVDFVDIPCETFPFGKHALAAYSAFARTPYTIAWLRSRRFERVLRDLVDKVSFDVAHFDTISLVPYASVLGDVPATLDHHNVESHMMLRRAEKQANSLKKAYFAHEGRRLTDYEARECDKFAMNLTCSELDSKRLSEICPRAEVEVVPNGVDTEYFRPSGQASSANRLVFAGRLNSYPNAEAVRFIVSSIWPAIKSQHPDVSMSIVGSSPPREAVELGRLDTQFEVTGYVEDVRPYIDRAGIYVCPIFDGGGTKLKILDAMGMQKAIVATRVACEGINLEHGKSVIFADNAEEFLEAITMLMTRPELADDIARNARAVAENEYSYTAIGGRLAALFEELAQSASS
jgi:glycosyltransferase involved in cell wall biosynthesis